MQKCLKNLELILKWRVRPCAKHFCLFCQQGKQNICATLTKLLKVTVLSKRHIMIFHLVHITEKHQRCTNKVSWWKFSSFQHPNKFFKTCFVMWGGKTKCRNRCSSLLICSENILLQLIQVPPTQYRDSLNTMSFNHHWGNKNTSDNNIFITDNTNNKMESLQCENAFLGDLLCKIHKTWNSLFFLSRAHLQLCTC